MILKIKLFLMSDSEEYDSEIDENESDKSGSESEDEGEMELSEKTREVIYEYMKLDDEIRDHRAFISDLNKSIKPMKEYILSKLNKLGEQEILIPNGKLQKNKTESKKMLKMEEIEKIISENVNSHKATRLMKKIKEKQTTTEYTNLKRIADQKKRKTGKKKKSLKELVESEESPEPETKKTKKKHKEEELSIHVDSDPDSDPESEEHHKKKKKHKNKSSHKTKKSGKKKKNISKSDIRDVIKSLKKK
jgi:hypothetical protein